MPLSVSKEISENNPYLEILLLVKNNNHPEYYPRCKLILTPTNQVTSDYCHQVEESTINFTTINFRTVVQGFVPSPIPCAQCPLVNKLTISLSPDIC
jgi:hypothetical protein